MAVTGQYIYSACNRGRRRASVCRSGPRSHSARDTIQMQRSGQVKVRSGGVRQAAGAVWTGPASPTGGAEGPVTGVAGPYRVSRGLCSPFAVVPPYAARGRGREGRPGPTLWQQSRPSVADWTAPDGEEGGRGMDCAQGRCRTAQRRGQEPLLAVGARFQQLCGRLQSGWRAGGRQKPTKSRPRNRGLGGGGASFKRRLEPGPVCCSTAGVQSMSIV